MPDRRRVGTRPAEPVAPAEPAPRGPAEPERPVEPGRQIRAAAETSASRSTTAAATKPPNIIAPVRSCARGSSRISVAKTSDTKNANSTSSRKWTGHLRPIAMSKASSTTSEFSRPDDDQEAVAVLVGDLGHDAVAGAGQRARASHGSPDAEIGDGGQRDQRLRQVERKDAAVQQQPDQEHRRQREQEDQPLLPAPEPEMAGPGHGPGRQADEDEHARLGGGSSPLGGGRFRWPWRSGMIAHLPARRAPRRPSPEPAHEQPSGGGAERRARRSPGSRRPDTTARPTRRPSVTAVGRAAIASHRALAFCARAVRPRGARPMHAASAPAGARRVEAEAAGADRQLDADEMERPLGSLMTDEAGRLVDDAPEGRRSRARAPREWRRGSATQTSAAAARIAGRRVAPPVSAGPRRAARRPPSAV